MSLFPEVISAFMGASVIGRAIESGKIIFDNLNIRDFADNKHKQADDYPFGGGAGMVMLPQPAFDCIEAAEKLHSKPFMRIYMSPRGKRLDAGLAKELSGKGLIILCGHYEGIDQRIIDEKIDLEISIGDYVLTGGELPALVLADAAIRHVPGVLSENTHDFESFSEDENGNLLLEYPQYTRPAEFRGLKVPDVLLSGHHANIEKWRREQSIETTKRMRPDIFDNID